MFNYKKISREGISLFVLKLITQVEVLTFEYSMQLSPDSVYRKFIL